MSGCGYEVHTIGDCQLIRGDSYELLPTLQADALITDPPYGIRFDWTKPKTQRTFNGLHSSGLNGDCWSGNIWGDDISFDPRPWLHFSQIVLWGAHLYATDLPRSAAWLMWDKREGTTADHHGDGELAWTNLAGVLRIHRQLWRGLIRAGEENAVAKLHPAQKPLALMRWCVEKTTGVVLDPFAGSFTTAHACMELSRPCIAIEIDPYYWEIGCRRIEAAYAQPRFPLVERRAPVQQSLLGVS